MCGSTQHLHSHHMMAKKSNVLRWSLENGITLCAGCHFTKVHSADGDICERSIQREREIVGESRWQYLLELKSSKSKLDPVTAYERLTSGGYCRG